MSSFQYLTFQGPAWVLRNGLVMAVMVRGQHSFQPLSDPSDILISYQAPPKATRPGLRQSASFNVLGKAQSGSLPGVQVPIIHSLFYI